MSSKAIKPKAVKRKQKLNPKQLAFIKAKARGVPAYKAVMEVYGSKDLNSASTQASRLLQNVTLREALEAALERQGFTIDAGARALTDALQAKRVSNSNGDLIESDLPDHGIRINAARTIFSMIGDKTDPEAPAPSIHFHNHQASQKEKYDL